MTNPTNAKKAELAALIESLVPLGEDADELRFWGNIFDDLEPGEQDKILTELRDELEKLKNA